jgi:hypothetical protein
MGRAYDTLINDITYFKRAKERMLNNPKMIKYLFNKPLPYINNMSDLITDYDSTISVIVTNRDEYEVALFDVIQKISQKIRKVYLMIPRNMRDKVILPIPMYEPKSNDALIISGKIKGGVHLSMVFQNNRLS